MKSWCMNKMRTSTKKKKKNQTKILELKNIITELKNSKEGINGRFDQAEEKKKKINELDGWVFEILESEWKKAKKKRRKVKKVKGTYGMEYHQADQHMHWGIPAREEWMKQAKWKTNSQMPPKSEKENGHRILRGSKDSN